MINELKEAAIHSKYVSRFGAHSHIKSLGFDLTNCDNKFPQTLETEGFVGQEKARKAAFVVQSIIKEGDLSGRIVVISGKPGTGKTALALALAKSLGENVPFVQFTASEVYSMELSSSEVLTQNLRKSIGIQIKEEVEVVEGELVEIIIESATDGTHRGTITLRTKDMESLYRLGPKLLQQFEKQNIIAGDIISLERATGKLVKLGRSFVRSAEYDAQSTVQQHIPTPSGELQKVKEVVHTVTLHDIDVINSRTEGFTALFAGNTGEISTEVRNQVDKKVFEWIDEGRAKIIPGVLFIDECHLLNLETYSFLNKALESECAPLLILATNRGVCKIRGTNVKSPHGIPVDFIDRALIIATEPYTRSDLMNIINQRIKVENINIDINAVELLVTIGEKTSLRYTLNLLSLSNVAAKKRKNEIVNVDDVAKCYNLFLDVDRSTSYLKEFENEFIS